jgi:hypothetical protein
MAALRSATTGIYGRKWRFWRWTHHGTTSVWSYSRRRCRIGSILCSPRTKMTIGEHAVKLTGDASPIATR